MLPINPLSSRLSQLSAKIQQAQNTPYNRLKIHSEWQQQHINAIEQQQLDLNERYGAIEQYSQNLEKRIIELQQHNEQLQEDLAKQLAVSPSAYDANMSPMHYPPISREIEATMLTHIHENTQFMQQIIHNQKNNIEKQQKKINALQHSFSWQITGPIRAGKVLTGGMTRASKSASKQFIKVHHYINERPKLKDNLLQLTGLKRLYMAKNNKNK